MKKLLVYSSMMMVLLSSTFCSTIKEEVLPPTGLNIIQNVNVRVKNGLGEDLLNPTNARGIKECKIYYLVNGIKTLYSKSNLDVANGYSLFKHPVKGYYYLQVQMDGGKDIFETSTLLQFGTDTSLDTIRTQYKPNPNNTIPEKIWHNGSLVWRITDREEPSFEIVKP